MRYIPFTSQPTRAEVKDLTLAMMLYPEDPGRAFAHFVGPHLITLGLRREPDDSLIELPAGWIKALVFPPETPAEKASVDARVKQGVTAGHLLLAAYLYAQTGKRVSQNAAIDVLERAVEARGLEEVQGVAVHRNKPEMNESWKAMRSVAHLWAGVLQADAIGLQMHNPDREEMAFGIAGALLEWGASCPVPPSELGSKLLDLDTAWRPTFPVRDVALKDLHHATLAPYAQASAKEKRRR